MEPLISSPIVVTGGPGTLGRLVDAQGVGQGGEHGRQEPSLILGEKEEGS